MSTNTTIQPMFASPMRAEGLIPRLIFFTDLRGAALHDMLRAPGVLDTLATQQFSVALGVATFDAEHAAATQLLNEHGVPLVAWLMLSPEQGFAFNSQNYPQAAEHYRAFREWVRAYSLHFKAVGLEIAPPAEVARADDLSPRRLARRFWLASENMLFPAAHAAYVELVATIRHDGYEVHAYQMPFIVDDRRAGTTLVQRALEIVDIPADVDVLLCSSSVPIDRLRGDMGGALISSYGAAADAIAVGGVRGSVEGDTLGPLPWHALQRDLLLAAVQTDTIYIDSLDGCVERGLLPHIAAMDWTKPVRAAPLRRALVSILRGFLFAALVTARFGIQTLAWFGWVVAFIIWLRGRKRSR